MTGLGFVGDLAGLLVVVVIGQMIGRDVSKRLQDNQTRLIIGTAVLLIGAALGLFGLYKITSEFTPKGDNVGPITVISAILVVSSGLRMALTRSAVPKES